MSYEPVPASAVPPSFTTAPPVGLPFGLVPYLRRFQNWAGDVVTSPLWTVLPATAAQCVALANWGAQRGWKIRPLGKMHNWSPLTVRGDETDNSNVLLVDTSLGLRGLSIRSSPSRVSVGTGVTMEELLLRLELAGRGIMHHPAPGNITVGGALAIAGHGTAIPANGERRSAGHSYGSLSNLIMDLDAIVWDAGANAYVLKTFRRNDPAIAPLLTHVGRAFITRVTLAVGPRQHMRCRSYTNIPATELLAAPGSSGRTVDSFLRSAGRMEVIWYPFTANPWLKVWSLTGALPPLGSRPVLTPYNYPFSDNLPKPITDLVNAILTGDTAQAPTFGATQYNITAAGLVSNLATDLWGTGRNLMLYVKPTTLRVTANGYAIICRRSDVQRILYEFGSMYRERLDAYRAAGKYPSNGPVEIRVTGVDNPADSQVAGAVDPWLSPTRRVPDRPDLDTAVWLDILTLPGTATAMEFFTEVEQWILSRYSGGDTRVRVEWSKGWGYTNSGAWTSSQVIDGVVPASLTQGQPGGTQYADAAAALRAYDPAGIYTSPLTSQLFG